MEAIARQRKIQSFKKKRLFLCLQSHLGSLCFLSDSSTTKAYIACFQATFSTVRRARNSLRKNNKKNKTKPNKWKLGFQPNQSTLEAQTIKIRWEVMRPANCSCAPTTSSCLKRQALSLSGIQLSHEPRNTHMFWGKQDYFDKSCQKLKGSYTQGRMTLLFTRNHPSSSPRSS